MTIDEEFSRSGAGVTLIVLRTKGEINTERGSLKITLQRVEPLLYKHFEKFE